MPILPPSRFSVVVAPLQRKAAATTERVTGERRLMTREHNWADNYTFSAGRIHRPGSVDELRRLVARWPGIRAIGTRHSFNGVADSPGDLVDLRGIDPDFLIDPERRTVTVGG